MVLENMVSGEEAEAKPFHVFTYSILATTVSLFVSSWIFPSQTSLSFLFLFTIAAMPMVYRVLCDDEAEDEVYERIDLGFLSIQKKAFLVFSYIFLGVLVASTFWYTVLSETYINNAFSEQIKTFTKIRGEVFYTGLATTTAGKFLAILINNLSVSVISLILSFFYGVGAVFILAWNASVIAVFLGKAARSVASEINHPLAALYGFFASFPTGILSIAIHGIPEIAAYFLAGIAGGILSIGIRKNNNGRIIKDSMALFGLCVALLIAAAFLEVWVTPKL